MKEYNKLVLIGNGFDLAHGLKTSYKDFLDWYMCDSFQQFCNNNSHEDSLIEIKNKYAGMSTPFTQQPITFEEVLGLISRNNYQSLTYKSNFFKRLLDLYRENNWVDIERYYFSLLKAHFSNPNLQDKNTVVSNLNNDFNFLIDKLSQYINTINKLYLVQPNSR